MRPDDAFIKISRRARAGRTPLVKTPHHGIVDGFDTTPSCRTLMANLPFGWFCYDCVLYLDALTLKEEKISALLGLEASVNMTRPFYIQMAIQRI